MDWNKTKFDWNRARAFLVTAQEGSLSAAGRVLNMAQPTIGRQITALEKELGVILFERVGRGLQLTPNGATLLEFVERMGQSANALSIAAYGQSQSIEGSITISASDTYAANVLPAIIAKLHVQQPAIKVEILTTNSASNLLKREADIAIRSFCPTEPELIAKKIRDVPARLYATAQYLSAIGNPKTIADLSKAEFIAIDKHESLMKGLNAVGFELSADNFPIMTENFLVMWEMVKQSIGIGILDSFIAEKEPTIVSVLPDMPPLMFPLWLVAHRELNTSRRIRVVFDLLAKELGKY
ncbi:MAG: LysR family transcriptional regulator [Rhizobiales bacterium]|nr:LysR family transcriptional regulator [Hyphomicrobiales bacterium]